MSKILITNANIVNEGKIIQADVLIVDERIEKIAASISDSDAKVIDAGGKYLLPGLIDDQVHFREPGLTHKADIYTESRAAVAGGVTSFMEMPNTSPAATTLELLEDKFKIAANTSLANYSFYLGTSNHNLEEIKKANPKNIAGIKIFMGSSTGNLVVDDIQALEGIFEHAPMIIATHCEDDPMIKANQARIIEEFGEDIDASYHPKIRNADACFKSSSYAISLAKKYGSRLHILHISTSRELEQFDNTIPLSAKKITAEACVHHLWFSEKDYAEKGNFIKWNPAVKSEQDRDGIFAAVLDGRIDVIATDHAPHTLEEKEQAYLKAPSGGPLIQHSLVAMLEFYHQGKISLEHIVKMTSHNVADLFAVKDRGYIREGYIADLVLVDLNSPWEVKKSNLLYKCGWSPFEGQKFQSAVSHTFINGRLAYENGQIIEGGLGQRLAFDR
jgi:dihydroorotase